MTVTGFKLTVRLIGGLDLCIDVSTYEKDECIRAFYDEEKHGFSLIDHKSGATYCVCRDKIIFFQFEPLP